MDPDETTDTPSPLVGTPLADSPFTRVGAIQAGLTRRTLQRLVDEGHLRVPMPNAYVPAHLPDTLETRARTLAEVTAPHVVIVDRTAAWFWGVSAYSLANETSRVPIDAFSLREKSRVRRPGVHSGSRRLECRDVVEVHGVRVTSPTRTALDLACCLERLEAVASLDALMRVQGLAHGQLLAELPRFRGRRGVIQAREVLCLVNPQAESHGESFLRVIIADEGFPPPELQVWVYDEQGDAIYRLDHAYKELMIGVEYDGEGHHTSEEDRRRDAERRAWLRSQGWIIIVVTKSDLAVHSRAAWVEELREARAERMADLCRRHARPMQRADRLTRDQLSKL